MKKTIITSIVAILLSLNLNAQNTGELSIAHKLSNNKLNWSHENCAGQQAPMIPEGRQIYDITTPITHDECWKDCGLEKQGIDVQIGRNFETNHLSVNFPADNNLAISNSGKIVSVDNYSIAYFNEDGDSIVQFALTWANLYGVSSTLSVFDPKVLYDSYEDRFILVNLLHNSTFEDSRILVSFSQDTPGVDSLSWNHYQIHCDSVYNLPSELDYWFDYPNIAVNKNELFISLNVFDFLTGSGVEAILFQIQKLEGINGDPTLLTKEWKNVEDDFGFNAYSIVPLMEASQQATYEDTMYFVDNYDGSSATYHWFELVGDINQTSAQIIPHTVSTGQFYDVPSYASQLGGNGTDRIQTGDCRIQNGYYQNGKLHFVHHRSDNGWSQVLYGRITMATSTFDHNTWGGDGTNMNYMYPSIAHFGVTPVEENTMITFARTGPSIFNEICVVNYENGWSPQTTIVKSGLDILNLNYDLVFPWDSLERIGDYTDIQRKYNDNTCWLIGSYPFGTTPNHFNSISGTNSWVAEVGRDGVGINDPEINILLNLYPNPVVNGVLFISGENIATELSDIQIVDVAGRVVKFEYSQETFEKIKVNISDKIGMFFVTIILKNGNHETFKVFINH